MVYSAMVLRTAQHHKMIVAGTSPPISIDLGIDESGMTMQSEYREGGSSGFLDSLPPPSNKRVASALLSFR